jgi:ATP-dependent DNA ligase
MKIKIKNIKKILPETRYDLEVEDNHNFFANNILVHNCRMVVTKNGAITRNGKPYVSCPHIEKTLKPFFDKYPNGVVDGEIYTHDVPFETVMSLVKKTKPEPEDLIASEKLCKLWIFDGIIDDQNGAYVNRFEDVKKEINNLIGKTPHLVFVKNEIVNNHDEFMVKHDEYVAKGYEGVILRYKDAPYVNKRTKLLLKYKSFIDEEFKLLDILEGKGNDAGLASKVVVQLNHINDTSEAGIRGSDEFSKNLLKNKKQYIGKKVTVRYQGFTKEGKLRFGVAVNFDPFDR